MTTLSLASSSSCSITTGGAALSRALRRAGVGKDSLIRVCGRAGLTAMIWLCRHGYQRAALSQAGGLGVTEAADVLLIPDADDANALAEILGRGARLRDGGLLIIQGGAAAPALLGAFGYVIEHRLSDKGRAVYLARRQAAGIKAAA